MFTTKLSDLIKENNDSLFSTYTVIFNLDTGEVFCEDADQLAYNDYFSRMIKDVAEIKDWFNLFVKEIDICVESEYGTSRIEVSISSKID